MPQQQPPCPGPAEFRPPPECPVFEPSWDEFCDPFSFIQKIRPIAEKTGICKVRPPPGWQPPFACDVDKLHFVPRIQRLNELEAQTRVKLNFLDQIAKFWDLQGCALKIPFVERKILDLYKLNKLVADEGGFDLVCHERRWTRIAMTMGFAPGKAIGSHLRAHYQKILYPYNLFQSGTTLLAPETASKLMGLEADDAEDEEQGGVAVQKAERQMEKEEQEEEEKKSPDMKEYKPHDLLAQRHFVPPPSPLSPSCPNARRGKRMKSESVSVKTEGDESGDNRPNLRRRMGSFVAKPEPEKEVPVSVKQEPVESQIIEPVVEVVKIKSRYKKHIPPVIPPTESPVDLVVCLVCANGADEDRLLLCDGCDDSYHTFCLLPPLHDVPKGDWRCPKCLAQECCKPQEAFGFEQAYRDYSLRAFGQMADAFKSDYFNMPVHMVPTELVEKEFWRLVGAIEEDVTVEYGADIASKEFGSGFPIRNGRFKVSAADEKYLSCGWNLNNMAMMEPSVLTHVTADICGMTLPWLYVGMCFSSFCWHIEDHWSYSINYLHWGEPKTWYGAPGFAAEQLEAVMKKLAPELFESQPDLLHQLVTIMNPNTLMSYGVPIYRTNQCAGEFVVTFPRAYHSGFNQGFNFAEAVNFCTVDWMPLGRQCVDHYRMLHRYNVFSHDEMVCNMASKASTLDVVVASAVHRDMNIMIRDEKDMRDKVKKMGVLLCKEARYDHLQDDERQCAKCRTTCYLSAITCPCSPGVLVCLHHAEDLCDCPLDHLTLNYRHKLDDLYPMMTAVRQRAELYDGWAARVTEALEAKLDKKKGVSVFRSLLSESEAEVFPDSDLLRRLRLVTLDAEKCSSVAQQLLNGKTNTRYRCGTAKSHSQLTVEELRSFVRQLYNLPCSLTQAPLLKELLNGIEDFQQHSEKVLSDQVPPGRAHIQALLDAGAHFDVELPELPALRVRLEQARWLEAVSSCSSSSSSSSSSPLGLEAMRRLIDQGVGLAPHPAVDRAMARLQELLAVSERWEEKAGALLKARPPHSIEALSAAAEKAGSIPAHLPSLLLLKDSVRRAREWLQEEEHLQAGACVPVLDVLSDLVLRGRAIQVHLEPLERLEALVTQLQEWKETTTSMFLMKNSPFTLLEVLCPRCEVGGVASSPKRKNKKAKDWPPSTKKKACGLSTLRNLEKTLTHCKDTTSAMATLEEARLREMEALLALRASNESKLLPAADCSHLKVCVCHEAPMGAMLQCELCRDAFHSVCVRDPSPSAAVAPEAEPWLCPLCRRGGGDRKPALGEARGQLEALQRARLPEGDALQHAVQRALCWQRRAAQHLSSSDRRALMTDRPRTPPTLTRCASSHGGHAPEDDNAQAPYLTPEWNRTQHAVFYTEHRCIPLQGLSSELEELMVEGLLLPVGLPEVSSLYHNLLNTPQSTACSVAPPQDHGHTATPCGTAPPQDDGHTATQCSNSNSQGKSRPQKEVGVSAAPSGPVAAAGEKKPKRPLERDVLEEEEDEEEEEEEEQEERGGGGGGEHRRSSKEDRKQLRHKRQRMNRRKKKTTSVSSSPRSDRSQSDGESDDAEITVCPAPSCLLPEGDQVHWVQCDGTCNQWFHQACVGVTAQLAQSQDYICMGCTM